jgi:hypothetical protein
VRAYDEHEKHWRSDFTNAAAALAVTLPLVAASSTTGVFVAVDAIGVGASIGWSLIGVGVVVTVVPTIVAEVVVEHVVVTAIVVVEVNVSATISFDCGMAGNAASYIFGISTRGISVKLESSSINVAHPHDQNNEIVFEHVFRATTCQYLMRHASVAVVVARWISHLASSRHRYVRHQ